MTASIAADAEYVLICGVPWEAYERILDALGEFHLRHTYDRGTLEMRRILYAVPPEAYHKFMEALPEHHLRHTYDGWHLEMMTPRKDHEWVVELLGTMLRSMAIALNIPMQGTGSTTLSTGDKWVQPDKSYYIAHERQVRGRDTYRPGEDPPPDLVVEVDVTNTSVPRLPIYAQIGVPEVWRHEDDEVQFYRLNKKGKYSSVNRSIAFPFLSRGDVTRFLERRHDLEENELVREFVAWAKKCSEGQT